MTPLIRSAVADDQTAIVSLVKSERLNPTDLDWHRFTVAVLQDRLIGAVQIRHHRDGSQELGSLVVVPEHRGRGVAGALIDAALSHVTGPVWMITRAAHVDHYARFGFARSEPRLAPRNVRFNYRIGRAARVLSWFKGLEPANLTLLVRQGP
jgi:N-acetylglutamate synthase-like GNAT family acetyltransferase